MTGLEIAGDVAEVLGPETVARIRAEARDWEDAECHDCGQKLLLRSETASVVLRIAPPEYPGELIVMCLTHARCASSAVRAMTWDEAKVHLHPGPDVTDEVNVDAAVLDDRPVLLVSFGPSLTRETDAGDLIDAVAATFLDRGWELIGHMEADPSARPADVVCHYQLTAEAAEDGSRSGQLTITVAGELLADISDMPTSAAWRRAVDLAGRVSIYIGPAFDTWGKRGPTRSSIRAGRVVGCVTALSISG